MTVIRIGQWGEWQKMTSDYRGARIPPLSDILFALNAPHSMAWWHRTWMRHCLRIEVGIKVSIIPIRRKNTHTQFKRDGSNDCFPCLTCSFSVSLSLDQILLGSIIQFWYNNIKHDKPCSIVLPKIETEDVRGRGMAVGGSQHQNLHWKVIRYRKESLRIHWIKEWQQFDSGFNHVKMKMTTHINCSCIPIEILCHLRVPGQRWTMMMIGSTRVLP